MRRCCNKANGDKVSVDWSLIFKWVAVIRMIKAIYSRVEILNEYQRFSLCAIWIREERGAIVMRRDKCFAEILIGFR